MDTNSERGVFSGVLQMTKVSDHDEWVPPEIQSRRRVHYADEDATKFPFTPLLSQTGTNDSQVVQAKCQRLSGTHELPLLATCLPLAGCCSCRLLAIYLLLHLLPAHFLLGGIYQNYTHGLKPTFVATCAQYDWCGDHGKGHGAESVEEWKTTRCVEPHSIQV